MNPVAMAWRMMERLPRPLAGRLYRLARRIPPLERLIDAELDDVLSGMGVSAPRVDVEVFPRLPAEPRSYDEILADVEALASTEEQGWRTGRASGAVYHGGREHIDFVNRVYALQSQSNPLHLDLWPSGAKFESEVVSMTAHMLGAGEEAPDATVTGTVTSGGTESILMAMKAYRDRAGIRHPEMIVPESGHVAFDKAARLLGYRQVRIPVRPDGRADVGAMAKAVTRRTVVMVGSAPGFPHGVIDPIPEMAEEATRHGVGLHVDACLGGFVLPWAERLGYEIPPFDFRVPGVTSISVDTHKYGYAPKGTSVVLYRDRELLADQLYVSTDWPGGVYYSTTIAGSRPGGLVAAAWASMLSMGETGYLAAAEAILATGAEIRRGIEQIPDLFVIGDPLWVIAFGSESVDIYEVMAQMALRGWSLNGLQRPPALHLAVTLRHTEPGVAEAFLSDLREAVAAAREAGGPRTGMAPTYGMAAAFPARSAVADLLRRYVQRTYEVDE